MNAPEMRQDALPATSRPCEGCAKPFTARRRWQRFCGDACRSEWHRKKALGPEGRLDEFERKLEALEARVCTAHDTLINALRIAREAMRGKDIEHIWINYPNEPELGLGAYLDQALKKVAD